MSVGTSGVYRRPWVSATPSGRKVGARRLIREAVEAWRGVESTVDSLELASGDEALQHLVDGRAIAEVEEIDGRPHVGRRAVLDALDDRRLEVAHGQWLRSTQAHDPVGPS